VDTVCRRGKHGGIGDDHATTLRSRLVLFIIINPLSFFAIRFIHPLADVNVFFIRAIFLDKHTLNQPNLMLVALSLLYSSQPTFIATLFTFTVLNPRRSSSVHCALAAYFRSSCPCLITALRNPCHFFAHRLISRYIYPSISICPSTAHYHPPYACMRKSFTSYSGVEPVVVEHTFFF